MVMRRKEHVQCKVWALAMLLKEELVHLYIYMYMYVLYMLYIVHKGHSHGIINLQLLFYWTDSKQAYHTCTCIQCSSIKLYINNRHYSIGTSCLYMYMYM